MDTPDDVCSTGSAQPPRRSEDTTIDTVIESVEQGIRAVKNYREDNPEEYTLWRAAVINSDKSL